MEGYTLFLNMDDDTMDYILYFMPELWNNNHTLDLPKSKCFTHICRHQIFTSSDSQSEICILHGKRSLTLTWQWYLNCILFMVSKLLPVSLAFVHWEYKKDHFQIINAMVAEEGHVFNFF